MVGLIHRVFCILILGLPLATQTVPAETTAPAESNNPDSFPRGVFVESIHCEHDPTQSYSLYLPTSYTEEFLHPVLFIFDPRGRSLRAGEIFREAAERYGWILLSSDNTRSDGPWEPNARAVAAMWPELGRYAYDPQRLYATGFSGGAMVAWQVGQQTGKLAGVISSGSRPENPERPDREVRFAHFGAAGEAEFNYRPTRALDEIAARAGAPHRFEAFEGPHRWMPSDLALEAIAWMEIQAMRSGKRAVDHDLVVALLRKDRTKAEALEASGKILEAERRYDSIARTFEGLIELEEVSYKAENLRKSSEFKRLLKQEKSAITWEEFHLSLMHRAIDRLKISNTPVGANRLAIDLRLSAMQRTAREETYKGLAARRALNSLNIFLSFYLPRDFLAEKDFKRAAVVLELATRIVDTRPIVWYNLACAWAQTGRLEPALEALSRAVEVGYRYPDYFESDHDLDPLRALPGFEEIADRIRLAAE